MRLVSQQHSVTCPKCDDNGQDKDSGQRFPYPVVSRQDEIERAIKSVKSISCDAIFAEFDNDGHCLTATSGCFAAFPIEKNTNHSLKYTDIAHQLDLPTWDEITSRISTNGLFSGVYWLVKPNNQCARHAITITEISNEADQCQGYLLQAVDSSVIQDASSELELHAYQDPLTGLHNRRYLNDMGPKLFEASDRMAVIMIDLQEFKKVNDTFGHDIGDLVLCHTAEALTEYSPLGTLIFRLGGDEFVLLTDGIEDTDQMQTLIDELSAQIATPVVFANGHVSVKANFGVAFAPEDADSLKSLLSVADADMYVAKNARMASTIELPKAKLNVVSSSLIRATNKPKSHQLLPYYQPILDIKSGEVVGAEALCRWQRASNDIVGPEHFISHATASDSISMIDRTMFSLVCNDMARWRRLGKSTVQISINLSAATLGKKGFMSFLQNLLDSHGIPPSEFCAELTESMMLYENDPGRECIFELRDLGIPTALDDFGTGYSSLALLKTLPIARLKIDQSFIQNIMVNPKDRRIVKNIIDLSYSLGTKSVAEGVEFEAQAKFLAKLGANFAQGFVYSKPIPADEFERDYLK